MDTRTTYRTGHRLLEGTATTLKDRMAHALLGIDIATLTGRHRMGSWEEFVSFRARALRRKTEKDASTQ